jgi:hypothetical protein
MVISFLLKSIKSQKLWLIALQWIMLNQANHIFYFSLIFFISCLINQNFLFTGCPFLALYFQLFWTPILFIHYLYLNSVIGILFLACYKRNYIMILLLIFIFAIYMIFIFTLSLNNSSVWLCSNFLTWVLWTCITFIVSFIKFIVYCTTHCGLATLVNLNLSHNYILLIF